MPDSEDIACHLESIARVGSLMPFARSLGAHGSFPANVLGPSILVGLGLSTAFVQLSAFSVESVQGPDAGLADGLVNTTRQVGGAVGLAVLTTLACSATTRAAAHHTHAEALTSGYRTAFAISAAAMAATAVLAALLTRHEPATEDS